MNSNRCLIPKSMFELIQNRSDIISVLKSKFQSRYSTNILSGWNIEDPRKIKKSKILNFSEISNTTAWDVAHFVGRSTKQMAKSQFLNTKLSFK